jgi:hypothetical protein
LKSRPPCPGPTASSIRANDDPPAPLRCWPEPWPIWHRALRQRLADMPRLETRQSGGVSLPRQTSSPEPRHEKKCPRIVLAGRQNPSGFSLTRPRALGGWDLALHRQSHPSLALIVLTLRAYVQAHPRPVSRNGPVAAARGFYQTLIVLDILFFCPLSFLFLHFLHRPRSKRPSSLCKDASPEITPLTLILLPARSPRLTSTKRALCSSAGPDPSSGGASIGETAQDEDPCGWGDRTPPRGVRRATRGAVTSSQKGRAYKYTRLWVRGETRPQMKGLRHGVM